LESWGKSSTVLALVHYPAQAHRGHVHLKSYLAADQKLVELYADQDALARKTILNVAASGKFSSDRSIAEYAKQISGAKPCPVK
jgi:glucan phosphorylase